MRTLDKLKVIIDNKKEVKHISDIDISQDIDWHNSFVVMFRADDLQGDLEANLGKLVKINFKEKINDKSFENSFTGIITEVATSRDAIQGDMIVFRGKCPTFYLAGASNCRSFADMSLNQIVDEVLKDYPQNIINAQVDSSSKTKIPYIVQYRESDYHFLSRLAAEWGEWFYFDGLKLYFGKRSSDKETELLFNVTLSKADLDVKIAPTQFIQHAYNYEKHEYFKSPSSKADVQCKNRYGQAALKQSDNLMRVTTIPVRNDIAEKKDLEDETLRHKSALVNTMVMFHATSDNPELRVGQVVTVKGAGEEDGKYIIISISHRMDSGGNYENHFEAVPASVTSPPVNLNVTDPIAEPQTATVVENKDPESLGRVRVRFIWDQQPSPWLRIISAHSGDNRGFYFVPEVDDEVVVGFENNNPDRPYIIGSVYHEKAKPSDWVDKKNNIKAIRTKSGNEIYFHDAPGKEEIRIFNKDSGNEIALSLSGEGKITIKSKGTLELSARNIKIDAQQSFECKAGAEAKIEAANASLKSSAKLEINGGALAEIKGGLVKIN